MNSCDVLIIGAGATGLMAARELSKAGKKVIILEARDRIGGRIYPINEEKFGFTVQGGAEFVHGKAPVTHRLITEAGLTYVPMEGELWSVRTGEPTLNPEFVPFQELLNEKLKALTVDMPISQFLETYFSGEKYADARISIEKMVEGYDAADPKRISTFSLRDEWLSSEDSEWLQGRIKEGYQTLLSFLESECKKQGVNIILNKKATSITVDKEKAFILCEDDSEYSAEKVIVTLPLPLISSLNYMPHIPEKIDAASKIGFGHVIKIPMKFKNQWWLHCLNKDFGKLMFMLSNEIVTTWWTQYPEYTSLLTGWIAGPTALQYKDASSDEIIELALTSLSHIFKIDKTVLKEELIYAKVINWPRDPLTLGAYSYTTHETKEAYAELVKPVNNKLFFAGEALYNGKDTATVEGALASGKETAEKIITSY